MNDMVNSIGRRMPSADWVALGVAIGCSTLAPIVRQLSFVVPIAIFLPSVLRELGLLHDGDEYTRRVMHRAGFHAMLVTALVVFLAWAFGGPSSLLTGEALRKAIMLTFVISYVLQYWGAREGAFRILLVGALIPLMELIWPLAYPAAYPMGIVLLTALPLFCGFVIVAFLTRKWPRVGGGLIMIWFAIQVYFAFGHLGSEMTAAAVPAIMLQACIVSGSLGLTLLLSRHETTEPEFENV